MRKLIGRFILWALGIKDIQRIFLVPGDSLLVTKPWWMSHEDAKDVAHNISIALGVDHVIVLPDGATLARLKSSNRIDQDEGSNQESSL